MPGALNNCLTNTKHRDCRLPATSPAACASFMDRKKVSSSSIRAVGYDPRSRTLEIEFTNGSIVQYERVAPDIHRALMSSGSIASFFRDRIEDEGYVSRRVR